MDFSGFEAIPAITILVYLAAELFKFVIRKLDKKITTTDLKTLIPVVCGVVGVALGIFCDRYYPGYIPSENIVVAAAIGAVSGFASTGIHQVVKQLGK